MQEGSMDTSILNLLEDQDEIPSNLGDAQVVIQIARWRAQEMLEDIEHKAKVTRTVQWVRRKMMNLTVSARINNKKYRDSQDVLDGLMVESLYANPSPLRKRFRNPQIDSLIRAANFYLSLYDTTKPPLTRAENSPLFLPKR